MPKWSDLPVQLQLIDLVQLVISECFKSQGYFVEFVNIESS